MTVPNEAYGVDRDRGGIEGLKFETMHDTIMSFLNRCVRAVSDDERRKVFNFRLKLMVRIRRDEIVEKNEINEAKLIGVVKIVAGRELKGSSDLALILSNVESYYREECYLLT